MPNEWEQKLVSLYDDIGLGSCAICGRCRQENPGLYARAVGAWFVGNEYEKQEKRVLFIGKNARGVPGIDYPENKNPKGYLEEFRYAREVLWRKGWPYWRYTEAISKALFGSLGMEAVTFTNLVKCNGSDTVDTTTESMKNHCICELGVVKKEIALIRPSHIVFYTRTFYDRWIPYLFDEIDCLSDKWIAIGKKQMPYGEYRCRLGNDEIKALRIGHPERLKKEAFVSVVVNWINCF